MNRDLGNSDLKAFENEGIFAETLKGIIAEFPKRSQEIIFGRFGVFAASPMTLEGIGKKYNITRERVRQVIREMTKKVKEKQDHPGFLTVKERVLLAMSEKSGIMTERALLDKLGNNSQSERGAIKFFLSCMREVVACEKKGEILPSYALAGFDEKDWRTVKETVLTVLKNEKRTLEGEEIHGHLSKNDKEFKRELNTLIDFLEISHEIRKNTYGKWGVATWKEVTPKGTREKAYLVLKEHGKPMHFREIAHKIDENKLNKKKTHPQTVHNELIKDEDFVLVGRGIYALGEWGYNKGTVKDVIESILASSSKSLTKEEILSEVMKIRQVKKTTVVINLNNYFKKSKEGTYSIKK